MFRFFALISFLTLASLPALAQEESTALPDYTKWELSEWDFQEVLYKGKPAHILGALYQDGNDARTVFVYCKPISEEQYQVLESLDPSEVEKRVDLLLNEAPLFLGYFRDGEDAGYLDVYEPSRKWFEIYRFWQPRLRFVKKLVTSGEHAEENLSEFIEKRYKFKFVED